MPRWRGEDLAGCRYGRLTVLREDGRDRWGQMMWLCRCDCGREVLVAAGNQCSPHAWG